MMLRDVVQVEVEGLSKWKGIIIAHSHTSFFPSTGKEPLVENGEVWIVEVLEVLGGNAKWNPVVGDKLPVWDEYMTEV
jgi:hypothetical protein